MGVWGQWVWTKGSGVLKGVPCRSSHTSPGVLSDCVIWIQSTGERWTISIHHPTTPMLAFSMHCKYRVQVRDEQYPYITLQLLCLPSPCTANTEYRWEMNNIHTSPYNSYACLLHALQIQSTGERWTISIHHPTTPMLAFSMHCKYRVQVRDEQYPYITLQLLCLPSPCTENTEYRWEMNNIHTSPYNSYACLLHALQIQSTGERWTISIHHPTTPMLAFSMHCKYRVQVRDEQYPYITLQLLCLPSPCTANTEYRWEMNNIHTSPYNSYACLLHALQIHERNYTTTGGCLLLSCHCCTQLFSANILPSLGTTSTKKRCHWYLRSFNSFILYLCKDLMLKAVFLLWTEMNITSR